MCLYIALGSFFIIVGHDRIVQTLYNFAQKISHYPYGWLILFSVFCEFLFTLLPCRALGLTHGLCDPGSCHLLPTRRRPYDSNHALRIRVWHEGVLYRSCGLAVRRCRDVRSAPPALQ